MFFNNYIKISKLVDVSLNNFCFLGKRKLKHFTNIMSFAESISKHNPNALIDLVRILGKKMQSYYITHLLISAKENRLPDLRPNVILFDEFYPLTHEGNSLFFNKKTTKHHKRSSSK